MPVKQSASKEEFVKALRLDLSLPEDKDKLAKMWEEVTAYWMKHFETSSRTILKPEYAHNPSVTKPYKWAHLNPVVIDNAIAEIWGSGKPWPRYYYNLGHSEDRKVYNWVLKWLLWHVCRYRDWRNRKNGAKQPVPMEPAMPTHDYWKTVMN